MLSRAKAATFTVCFLFASCLNASLARGDEIGQVKFVKGSVRIERGSQQIETRVGTPLYESDIVVTDADGSAGITFSDESLISLGPGSVFAVARYRFDPSSQEGAFDTILRKGTLYAVSGKLARHSGDAMKVQMPRSDLYVHEAEVLVRAAEEQR